MKNPNYSEWIPQKYHAVRPATRISIVGGEVGEFVSARLGRPVNTPRPEVYLTGEDALDRIPNRMPDLVLVDLNLPCIDGFECVGKLKARLPELPVLMVAREMRATQAENDALIFSALQAGASGFLPMDIPTTELIAAIAQVREKALQRRRLFLMFFDSDRQLGASARHWHKIAMMLRAPAVTISYVQDWRKVVLISNEASEEVHSSSRLLPLAGKISAVVPAAA